MELQFQNNRCRCLRPVVYEVQNQEQTQELKLTDAMPDIGRVLGAWGQVILRGKEWRGDSIGFSGGVMVWVLYAPEDGGAPRSLDTWIPFQMRWSLPEGCREGDIRMEGRLRFLDARSVSPRKMMLRAGIGALAQALEPWEADVYTPGELPEDVAVLKNTYPVCLHRETGERTFLLDEDLTLPDSVPVPEKLIYASIQPRVREQKIINGRAVFKGAACLHVLYLSREGRLHNWDYELPFSQFGELNEAYSGEGLLDVAIAVTNLDVDLDGEGHLRLKCGLAAQYLADDRILIDMVEDAYSPRRGVEPVQQEVMLATLLDRRSETLSAEQSVPMDGEVVADVVFLPDYPRQRRMGSGVRLECPGQFQYLYYGPDGSLQSGQARWEGGHTIEAHENSLLHTDIVATGMPETELREGKLHLKSDLELRQKTYSSQGMTMLSGLQLGDIREPDPARPSVILRRGGSGGLWKIAKECGSTVDAIRNANHLREDLAEDRMLLIPVL